MEFVIVRENEQAAFCVEQEALSGVKKIAAKVANDIKLVTDREFEIVEGLPEKQDEKFSIMAATIGHSAYLDELENEKQIDLSKVRGKREVYLFTLIQRQQKNILLIAGSDKRGTIYGLFHLSELLEVSPWVYFADVKPRKQKTVVLDETVCMTSKEPSVKYRGLFINDEWPSYGNWTFRHFDGFTTKMYDHVFELILRLKGNYLWPAMWTSNFSLDGPGFSNAELADEYGIVMSNSHHEPCLRHSEEWDLVKGEDTIYGKDWNFDKNKKGLTNYWRDGLKRNGALENIITMGMRGERDSEILGHTATLKENIDYLKEVITTQNQLIKECVNENLDEVPRMLALYKEVEAYFYGDEKTPGLKDWKELDGITFMLCEDNFGNMRTLPTKENKDRKGGWGMYYHFDYHGDPVSYEWVNSTYLPKVWEQMCMAYEFGIRDIWIVNVGDLKPQELPLSYFMDLAYDFDKWGSEAPNSTALYTKKWVAAQFADSFDENGQKDIYDLLDAYTRQNHISKPEALRVDTYHPTFEKKADALIDFANEKIHTADRLLEKITVGCRENCMNQEKVASFYQLVYYPVVASFNQLKLMLYAGKNHLYAKQGRVITNIYAEKMKDMISRDKSLQNRYHQMMNGKWDGIMMSEHVGFAHWNDEECSYPIMCEIMPANKPRVVVAPAYSESYSMGGDWTRKTLHIYDFMNPRCKESAIDLANGSYMPINCTVSCDADWLKISEKKLRVDMQQRLLLTLDEDKLKKAADGDYAKATIKISTERTHVLVEVFANTYAFKNEKLAVPFLPEEAKISDAESNAYLLLQANDFTDIENTEAGKFVALEPFGKYQAGLKAFPVTKTYTPGTDAPFATYECEIAKDGEYEITIITAPSNPISIENLLRLGFAWDDEEAECISTVKDNYRGGERSCPEWAVGVIRNEHRITLKKEAKAGIHKMKVFACDPAFVLEGIEIRKTR